MDYWAVNNIYYYPGAEWTDGSKYFDGYQWQEIPIYNQSVDREKRYGSSLGLPRHSLVGGFYNGALLSGSRTMYCNILLSAISTIAATRGCRKQEYPGATWKDNDTNLSGYGFQESPVYKEPVDSSKYGSSHGLPRRSIFGGSWYNSSNCGSRSVNFDRFPAHVDSAVTSRGCKENSNILGRKYL